MKVNFILDMEQSLKGSGVYSSATRLAEKLQQHGIKTEINGNKPPYDIYHFQTSLPQSFLKARLLSQRTRRKYKVLMTGHTTIEDFRNSFLFSNRIDRILTPYLKKYYSYADYLVAVSEYNRDILLGYGYDENRIEIISNGIDLKKIRRNEKLGRITREKLNIPKDQLLIVTVGICIYRKAPDVFTDIALSVPEHEFLWIGKYFPLGTIAHSPYLRDKFKLARKHDNIQFTGYISKKTFDGLLNAGDIFLYVSREENQGIALLEAIAYGLVPVVRDHPVFSWLTDNVDSLKGTTVNDFANCIRKLEDNRTLLNKLKIEGKKSLQAHDIEKSVAKLANLYTSIS
ncbi:MAG: glycosyltransferase family 4 protein [Candidatus Hodarchaeales archaeon]